MKRVFASLMLLCTVVATKAQTPENMKPSVDDALFVLNAMGVEMLRFDFSKFQDRTYRFTLYIDEYNEGIKQDREYEYHFGENRIKISQEEAHELKDRENFDSENSVLLRNKDLGIYILPQNDSIVKCQFQLRGSSMGMPLKLKELKPTSPRFRFSYGMRPFKINEYDPSKPEIPLMLYASFWYDEKSKMYRFCGEREIDPDLSNEILKYTPHYYIIGVRLEEVE